LTDGRNQVGLFALGAFKRAPTLGPAGDGSVKVAGQAWAASAGFEASFARQIFAPTEETPMEVTLDFPIAVLPRVHQPSGAEIFDPTTGRAIGPAPDYTATLFTPRVSLRYRTEWPVQVVVSVGGGIALFSETRNGQTYKETGYPVQFLIGLSTRLRPHWAVRGQFGRSVHGVAVERGLYVVNGGIVYVF
jgi:hypothetical protein